MGITIVEAAGKSISPDTIMRLSRKGVVIFDFNALMQGDLSHWKEAIGGRPSFLGISQETPRNSRVQAEIILYSGEEYDYDDVRTAIGRNGRLIEVIGMVTVDFPVEHEGTICFLNREVPSDDPMSETLELFATLIEDITPQLKRIQSGVYGEGRAHIVMERQWRGMVTPPPILDGYGGLAVDPQEGSFVIMGKNGYAIGMANREGNVVWGDLNEPLSEQVIMEVINSFIPTAKT